MTPNDYWIVVCRILVALLSLWAQLTATFGKIALM